MVINFELHLAICVGVFLCLTLIIPRLLAIELRKVKSAKIIFGILYCLLHFALILIVICFSMEQNGLSIKFAFITNNAWFSPDNFVVFQNITIALLYFCLSLPFGFYIAMITKRRVIFKTFLLSFGMVIAFLLIIIGLPINLNICLINLVVLLLGGLISGLFANALMIIYSKKDE